MTPGHGRLDWAIVANFVTVYTGMILGDFYTAVTRQALPPVALSLGALAAKALQARASPQRS
ncbi:MAG: hypothetical protein AUK51_13795 [Comamonadaceae bacterium CG2_30_59_20]|nr:MAG: hypothetical protein AUK51_13795 [Comamonadaceae bacterium CG2_30_59_20]